MKEANAVNKHALVIDHELCWGCRTCEVACHQEYDHEVNSFTSRKTDRRW